MPLQITVSVGGVDNAIEVDPVVLKDRLLPDEEVDHFRVADVVAEYVYKSRTVSMYQQIMVRVAKIGETSALRCAYRLKPQREHFEVEDQIYGTLPDTVTIEG